MKYNDFELLATHVKTIKGPGKNRITFQVQVPRSPAGELIEGIPSEYDAREMREHLKALDDWSQVIKLGNWLSSVLFPSTMYDLLVRSLDVVRSSQEGLRIRLLLEGDLHNIPWEYMLLNRGGGEATVTDLLGLMPNVSIVRHQAATLPAWDITAELPAQMVVALASPATYPPLNLKEEQRVIEQALEENPYVNATFVPEATLETLLPDIQHTHLFHFAGHGDFAKQMGSSPGTIEGKGVLIVDDGWGHPEQVSASQLALQLRQAGVRVAVLGACQSGRRDNTNVWSSVATSLLKADLGAVVGMQDTFKDKSAIAFAKNFYRALVSGLPIDEAVTSGRIAIACTDPKGWGIPVLYLRAPDGVIFPKYAENQALEEGRNQLRINIQHHIKELVGVNVKIEIGEPAKGTKVELNIQYPYFQARPADLSRSFDSLIAERTKNFVGREFVFKALNAFLADKDQESGYFIIKGEPGIGKSALMAHLVKERGYIHHFNIALQAINKPRQFLKSVCAQLIARFELEHETWPPDAEKDGAFLNQLLGEASEKLQQGEQLVIAIDALDEADLTELPSRANTLYLPPNLPSNVFFVVTTRLKHDIRLEVLNPRMLEVKAKSDDNLQDARSYINFHLPDEQMQARIISWNVSPEQFTDKILAKSEGNFMYLHHVLPAIRAGRFVEGRLDELPEGLLGYYRSHWRQMKSKDEETFEKFYQPVVCVLAAVKEAVSVAQVAAYTELAPNKIRDVIRGWREFLYEELNKERERVYRVYHTSFQEFLQDEVDPGLKTYHKMIAGYYLRLAGKGFK